MTTALSYKYFEKNSKETVLFLHGWGCNKNYMLPLTNSEKYNSLIIDLPGFGENEPLLFPYYIDDYVEDIILFINSLDIKITYIVAHSFGGKLATRLSTLLKTNGQILISPSIYHKFRGPKYYLKVLFYKVIKKIKLFKNLSLKMGSDDYKTLSPIMKKTMSNVINESVVKDIKQIKTPTVLLFGDNDEITPLNLGKKIKRKMKDCELIKLKGNHFAYLYNKRQVIKIIESLVSSTC